MVAQPADWWAFQAGFDPFISILIKQGRSGSHCQRPGAKSIVWIWRSSRLARARALRYLDYFKGTRTCRQDRCWGRQAVVMTVWQSYQRAFYQRKNDSRRITVSPASAYRNFSAKSWNQGYQSCLFIFSFAMAWPCPRVSFVRIAVPTAVLVGLSLRLRVRDLRCVTALCGQWMQAGSKRSVPS